MFTTFVSLAVWIIGWLTTCAFSQSITTGIEYLGGVPGFNDKMKGELVTGDIEIYFNKITRGDTTRQFSIRNHHTIYVAVGEDVKSRLLYAKQAGIMASKLLGIPGLIFKIIPGGSPKEIISVE